MPSDPFHPILSCSESLVFEKRILSSEPAAWEAMNRAGSRLGRALRSVYAMSGFRQSGLRVLGLIGKGHNGGDALLAFCELAKVDGYLDSVSLVFSGPRSELRSHTLLALSQLEELVGDRLILKEGDLGVSVIEGQHFDICLDGLLGMLFRPPLKEGVRSLIRVVNASKSIRLRAAVDLPSGIGDNSDEEPFVADYTFATGIFKRPLLNVAAVGAVCYLDIGFFENGETSLCSVVTDSILDPLRALRSPFSEKRQHGHLAIVAGSRSMPGALSMSVHAALQSGVGLVTVFAPESIVSQLACQLPEAMWRTWPETPEGGLALEGVWQIKSILDKATALLLGPGMGADRETQALLCEIGRLWDKPAVLDADALRPEVVEAFLKAGNSELVLTPHDGEFFRLSGVRDVSDGAILEYAKQNGLCLVKKGPQTRISNGDQLCVNTSGNPVLSRGGSGDLLAGLLAGLLAQGGGLSTLDVACRAVYWHGKAADLLAITKGQTAVRTTDLLDFLSPALQCREVWNSNFPVNRPFGP